MSSESRRLRSVRVDNGDGEGVSLGLLFTSGVSVVPGVLDGVASGVPLLSGLPDGADVGIGLASGVALGVSVALLVGLGVRVATGGSIGCSGGGTVMIGFCGFTGGSGGSIGGHGSIGGATGAHPFSNIPCPAGQFTPGVTPSIGGMTSPQPTCGYSGPVCCRCPEFAIEFTLTVISV